MPDGRSLGNVQVSWFSVVKQLGTFYGGLFLFQANMSDFGPPNNTEREKNIKNETLNLQFVCQNKLVLDTES